MHPTNVQITIYDVMSCESHTIADGTHNQENILVYLVILMSSLLAYPDFIFFFFFLTWLKKIEQPPSSFIGQALSF